MGYFQVRYDSKVVNYDRKGVIRLATDLRNSGALPRILSAFSNLKSLQPKAPSTVCDYNPATTGSNRGSHNKNSFSINMVKMYPLPRYSNCEKIKSDKKRPNLGRILLFTRIKILINFRHVDVLNVRQVFNKKSCNLKTNLNFGSTTKLNCTATTKRKVLKSKTFLIK